MDRPPEDDDDDTVRIDSPENDRPMGTALGPEMARCRAPLLKEHGEVGVVGRDLAFDKERGLVGALVGVLGGVASDKTLDMAVVSEGGIDCLSVSSVSSVSAVAAEPGIKMEGRRSR